MFDWLKKIFMRDKTNDFVDEDIDQEYELEMDMYDNFKQICMEIVENYCIANALALSQFNDTIVGNFVDFESYVSNEIVRLTRNFKNVINEETYDILIECFGSEALVLDLIYTKLLHYYMAFRFGVDLE
jgi:AAA+ ATPase superfamily predicted ATPase